MYLVDTSVWIDYFRERNNSVVQHFIEILDTKTPYGITGVIYQEILQGAESIKDFQQLSDYLSTQHVFTPHDALSSYHAAAKIFFDCRRKGITVRSTIDCLIAQIAIEHNLILLHNDKDYEVIKKVNAKLRTF